MNKNELKKLVKERIQNQIATLESTKFNETKKQARELYNKIFTRDVQYDLNKAVQDFKEVLAKYKGNIGSFYKTSGNFYWMGRMEKFVDTYQEDLERILQCAWGNDWTSAAVTRRVEGYSPEARAVIKEYHAKIYDKYHVQRTQLEKMEVELIAIITASKTAAAAVDTLKDMGINLDIPEAKKVTPMLPAVVKLTVDTKLFNESLTTEK